MSWDGYVASLTSDGIISKASIIGLNGSIWTEAGGNASIMNVEQGEAITIGTTMAKKDETVSQYFAANGITVDGVKYMFLRDLNGDGRIMTGRIMTGKKVQHGTIILASTKQAVIIAFIPEDKAHSFGSANATVEEIMQYFEGVGY